MIPPAAAAQIPSELDVRELRKPDKHPTIFAAYAALALGESFVLINDHDPKHLHDEFESDHPGSYRWEYLNTEPRDWRIMITKLASTPLPRILVNTADAVADPGQPDATGAVWKLQTRARDVDSNLIALAPGGTIDAHTGPDLDVLVHVLAGSGHLVTERDTVDLRPGALVWLPRRSRREFVAGPDGLRYLTVHQRRQALVLDTSRAKSEAPTRLARVGSPDSAGPSRRGSAEPSRTSTVEPFGARTGDAASQSDAPVTELHVR